MNTQNAIPDATEDHSGANTDSLTAAATASSDSFEDLPPSAKLVYHIIEDERTVSRTALQKQASLPDRTLSRALTTLQNGGYITLARDPTDLRRIIAKLAAE